MIQTLFNFAVAMVVIHGESSSCHASVHHGHQAHDDDDHDDHHPQHP
jgi:hypothetical protein